MGSVVVGFVDIGFQKVISWDEKRGGERRGAPSLPYAVGAVGSRSFFEKEMAVEPSP